MGDDSVRRSCVREVSSQPHTPKGTAARLLGPDPARTGRRVPRSMHEGPPTTQRLLACTGGLRGIRLTPEPSATGDPRHRDHGDQQPPRPLGGWNPADTGSAPHPDAPPRPPRRPHGCPHGHPRRRPPPGGRPPPWAALACLLAPAALLWRGAPFLTAAGAACGLAAVTAASRLLIRRSRRLAAPAPSRRPGATAHSRRPGPAPHARRAGALPHARAHARRDAGSTPAG